MVIGLAVGLVTIFASRNFPAAICIGAGITMLLNIVTNLEVDRKIRN